MTIIYWLVALFIFLGGVFAKKEFDKSGKYIVRMNTTIYETSIVKGQWRSAIYKPFDGWYVEDKKSSPIAVSVKHVEILHKVTRRFDD